MRQHRLSHSSRGLRRGAFLSSLFATAAAASAPAQPAGVSVGGGGAFGNGPSALASNGAISRWGNAVVFISDATNLVAADTNGVRDVFVRDMLGGATVRVSVSTSGAQANGPSGGFFGPGGVYGGAISANGAHVAFTSLATDLIASDTNGVADVFVRDRDVSRDGVMDQAGDVRTVNIGQLPGFGMPTGACSMPSLSMTGQRVAFVCAGAVQPFGDPNGAPDVYVHDRDWDGNGVFDETFAGAAGILHVSQSSAGVQGNANSYNPTISGDGRFVCFESNASNLVAGDTNGQADVFVHDLTTGATTRVSVSSGGAEGNNFSGSTDGQVRGSDLSSDGRFVAFESWASNLAGGDTNGVGDVFVHDRATGQTARMSVSTGGAEGNSSSFYPSVSDDGRIVTFSTFATNLGGGGGAAAVRFMQHDRDADGDGIFDEAGAISTVEIGRMVGPSTDKMRAALDPTGSFLAFFTDVPLVAGDTNGLFDVYRDGVPAGSADADADGLLDTWERNGIDYDGDGTIDLAINQAPFNANPRHKDLFVEVDWMTEDLNGDGVLNAGEDVNGNGALDVRPLAAQAQNALTASFANAPSPFVSNPDGLPGVDLRLLYDEPIPFAPWAANPWAQFAATKQTYFGTAAERAGANWPNIRAARCMTFRYCIMADSTGGTSVSGAAEFPGDDLMVTLGNWPTAGGTWQQQAGVFLHELGHTLGLDHGGGDAVNYKPNYHSVMNYTWTVPSLTAGAFQNSWTLDFSDFNWGVLDESSLNEVLGINGHPGHVTLIGPVTAVVAPESGSVDWNGDGVINAVSVARDINYVVPTSVDPLSVASPGQVLSGSNDWGALQYGLPTAPGAANCGITFEIVEYLATLAGGCEADLTGDGAVDGADLAILLGAWGPADEGDPADLTGDGAVDGADLATLLGGWGECGA